MFKTLLHRSPTSRLLFITDCQYGPARAQRRTVAGLAQFWQLHDAGRLRFNTLYDIVA
jgi:hypothetical protein